MSFTMGTLMALFTLDLLGSTVAFMFHHFQNQILEEKFPFDVQVYSSQINAWLYTHFEIFGDDYRKADQTPDQEIIKENDERVYCDYDTYMGLSDYNYLRRMLGLKEIELNDH